MVDGLNLEIRSGATLERVATVPDYSELVFVDRWLAPGSWSLKCAAGSEVQAAMMMVDQPGIVLADRTVTGGVAHSGPATRYRVESGDPPIVTFAGVDDTATLWTRRAEPDPSNLDAPATDADVIDAMASTRIAWFIDRNLGHLSRPERRIPIAPVGDPLLGPVATSCGRYQSLGDLVAEIATVADLTVTIRQIGAELVASIGAARINPDIIFAPDWGTMSSYSVEVMGQTATDVTVAGSGEGSARMIARVSDAPMFPWGRRVERFADARNEADRGALVEKGAEVLRSEAASIGVDAELIEADHARYRRDFDLGDYVRLEVFGFAIPARVVEVETRVSAGGVARRFKVGHGVIADPTESLARAFAANTRKIRNLERR